MKKYTTIAEFLDDLSPERKEQVEVLRTVIHEAEPGLIEHIKWNAPSYIFGEEDRVTFNTHYPDKILLILHMGATRKEDTGSTPILNDPTGLISWNSNIRGTLSFSSSTDITARQHDIVTIIRQWLMLK